MFLNNSETVTSDIADKGPSYSLILRNFDPIQHGGNYKCIGYFRKYIKSITGPSITVRGEQCTWVANRFCNPFVRFVITLLHCLASGIIAVQIYLLAKHHQHYLIRARNRVRKRELSESGCEKCGKHMNK